MFAGARVPIMMMMIQFTKQIIQGINISLANKAGPLHPPGSFMKEQVSRCLGLLYR